MVNPAKPPRRPHCYICGSTADLTDDHIPPKSFFPIGQRENLFTADCCKDCHRRLSMDDEAARLWLSSAASASLAGKWIWHNEAFPSLQRKPKLLEKVTRNGTSYRNFSSLRKSSSVLAVFRSTATALTRLSACSTNEAEFACVSWSVFRAFKMNYLVAV